MRHRHCRPRHRHRARRQSRALALCPATTSTLRAPGRSRHCWRAADERVWSSYATLANSWEN
eukprot:5051862-Pyramimonas_sp.AAC.1